MCMCTHAGADKPRIRDLMTHVVPYIHDKWRNLGYILLTEQDTRIIIKQIDNDVGRNVERCTQLLFEKWLERGYVNATWDTLIEALKDDAIGLVALAYEIKDKLSGRAGN